MLGIVEWLLVVSGLLVVLYYYMSSTFDYWKSRGVKGPKPLFFLGSLKDTLLGKYSMGQFVTKLYWDYKNEPYFGIFLRHKPLLVLNDLELVKDVLIKDFNNFSGRGMVMNEDVEPLSAHLFNLEYARWRPLRQHLSPVFTSGKLREMFYLLVECADNLEKVIDDRLKHSNDNELIAEVRDFTAKFTTDVIGVCAFGLQMNAMADEDSPFRVMGRRIFQGGLRTRILFTLRTMTPKLFRLIGRFIADREMNDFFVNTTRQTMDYRKKNGVVKHDFVDLLMDIRDHPDKLADIELTDSLLAAQLFVFFIAGFETSSTTMSNALYELALNHEIQDKLREEIIHEIESAGGVLKYDSIKGMKYLDMVFQETLRKYPPVMFLARQAVEPYTFKTASGNKLLTIEKDQNIWIPAYAFQMDPEYYPEPDIFDPERFTPEAIKTRNPMTYLAFGDGPRNCIGKRFGVMQTKVGLVKILQHYRIETCEKTQVPYVIDPKAFLLAPKGGLWLKITRHSDDSTHVS